MISLDDIVALLHASGLDTSIDINYNDFDEASEFEGINIEILNYEPDKHKSDSVEAPVFFIVRYLNSYEKSHQVASSLQKILSYGNIGNVRLNGNKINYFYWTGANYIGRTENKYQVFGVEAIIHYTQLGG